MELPSPNHYLLVANPRLPMVKDIHPGKAGCVWGLGVAFDPFGLAALGLAGSGLGVPFDPISEAFELLAPSLLRPADES